MKAKGDSHAPIPGGFRAWVLQDWHRYSPGEPKWKAVLGALIFNAGFLAVFLFRSSQALDRSGHDILSRLAWRLNLVLCAVEIHSHASVGSGLYLPHPYCVTVGQGCCLGKDVTLYQGVCLGARTSSADGKGAVREYPEVGDGVVLYPHALIYGLVKIGAHATILGNSVVACDIPPDSVYGGIPAQQIKKRKNDHAQQPTLSG